MRENAHGSPIQLCTCKLTTYYCMNFRGLTNRECAENTEEMLLQCNQTGSAVDEINS